MRTAILPLILAVAAAPLTARQAAAIQQNPKTAKPAADSAAKVAAPAVAVESTDSGKVQLSKATVDSLTQLVSRYRRDPEAVALPPENQIAMGGRTIPAGTTVAGPVAVAGGPLHVYGTVNGDAIAIGSDVIVHPGARITGNAVSALGTVNLAGGIVGGEIRQLAGALGAVPQAAEAESRAGSTRHALALSSSWLIILVLMAIGVLLFAGDYLDGVVDSLEGRFGRSFWAGIATQLALAPVLCLLVIALAVTILGVLLIPFAIVAFVLAVVGLITLGFLAIARITGESVAPAASKRYSARGAALRALVVGVSIYMGLWVLASAFAWAPVVETVLRGVAVAITWVATTAGLGAAVISRGGTKRSAPTASFAAVNDIPWQTPTPVTGVVAARRPTPSSSGRDR
ncbi:MAG TPA: hypothetical protein VIK41_13655 [Gemmatimonadaceae bacterium]